MQTRMAEIHIRESIYKNGDKPYIVAFNAYKSNEMTM